jgi:hypothetical protein
VPTSPGTADPQPTFRIAPPPPLVAWADGGERLAVVTQGSSSCPSGPTDVAVVGDQELRLEIGSLFPGRDPCTADMATTTTEVDLPDGLSADEPVTVRLRYAEGGERTVLLPPAGR